MKEKFLPKYRDDFESATYETHSNIFLKSVDYFKDINLKVISVSDCERYRTWVLTDSDFPIITLVYFIRRLVNH